MSSCLIIEALLELGSIFVVLRLQFGKLLRQGRIVASRFLDVGNILVPRGDLAVSYCVHSGMRSGFSVG